MDFLGIGPLELLFILVIALIVVGPRDLARTARSLGRQLNRLYRSEFWRTVNEASRELRTLPNRLAREAALEDLDATRQSLRQTAEEVNRETQELARGMQAWTPTPPPPPAEPPEEAAEPEQPSTPE